MEHCNTTEEYERIDEAVIWKGMQFHHFGLILSALFGLIAILLSWYLIWRHCTHYLKPWEQRHIIRVLFLVPIYASVSFLSYYYYRHAVYFEVIRDCYEAFAIASFFSLLCHYIAPDLHSQKDYFRRLQPRKWVWPMNWLEKIKCLQWLWRVPRSGLTWFNIIWFGIFQYCFIRVFMTLIAVVSQAAGRYCLESLNPEFAHVWVMVIEGLCVSVAMYLLIQFYVQTKDDLHDHRPLLKVAAIKLVIFLSFWQTILISFLTSSGAIKPSATIQTPDIKIGIPSMLLCIEMAIFAVLHLWAFPWQVYDIRRSAIVASESVPGFLPDPQTAYRGGRLGHRALMDAFNPWDIIKAVGRGFRWIAIGRKRRTEDTSYKGHTHSASLEPTRNQFTAFEAAKWGSREELAGPFAATNTPQPSRYSLRKTVSHEDDFDELLHHAQANPRNNIPDIRFSPYDVSINASTNDLSAPHEKTTTSKGDSRSATNKTERVVYDGSNRPGPTQSFEHAGGYHAAIPQSYESRHDFTYGSSSRAYQEQGRATDRPWHREDEYAWDDRI